MLVKTVSGEVCVALQNVHDHWPPSDNVALLCFFIQESIGADDVSAETSTERLVSDNGNQGAVGAKGTYGIRAASVSALLAFLSSPSS